MTEIPVFELDMQCDERSVFVLRLNEVADIPMLRTLRGAWAQAWTLAGRPVPVLMIFDPETQLSTLTGEQLRQAGLMRLHS